jgi:NAD dependent epimerase/dehydratase family enzyme
MLKIILGEFADYVLTGKKVLPKKAEENGFRFKFEYIEKALINILKK